MLLVPPFCYTFVKTLRKQTPQGGLSDFSQDSGRDELFQDPTWTQPWQARGYWSGCHPFPLLPEPATWEQPSSGFGPHLPFPKTQPRPNLGPTWAQPGPNLGHRILKWVCPSPPFPTPGHSLKQPGPWPARIKLSHYHCSPGFVSASQLPTYVRLKAFTLRGC